MSDPRYREIFLTPLRECAHYVPQLGGNTEEGVNLEQFHQLYGADPLYSWVGLDSPEMYAAHKAAGGMTSVYRQLGIGCERLVREIFKDALALTPADLLWGYDHIKDDGKVARLTLDARISLDRVALVSRRATIQAWVRNAAASVGISAKKRNELVGAVFEVRQGYKSADSKRQNADLRSALKAYQEDLLPVVMVVSSQMSGVLQIRYRANSLLVLVGTTAGSPSTSTFAFFRDVVGYDLADFFARNRTQLRSEVQAIVAGLLSA